MEKWIKKYFLNDIRRAIDDYNLIEKNDSIILAVSGGKDSLLMAYSFNILHKYQIYDFDYKIVIFDNNLIGDLKELKAYFDKENMPYEIHKEDLRDSLDFEGNPCFTCARIRRGILKRMAEEQGYKKIALGHTKDDLVETFLMNVIANGRISSIPAISKDTISDMVSIRPLVYVDEKNVIKSVEILNLPIVTSTCPMNNENFRGDVDSLVERLEETYPDIKDKVLSALSNVSLDNLLIKDKKD